MLDGARDRSRSSRSIATITACERVLTTQHVGEAIKADFVVDNNPGAGGTVASEWAPVRSVVDLIALANTPPAIARRLSDKWAKVRQAPEVDRRFGSVGTDFVTTGSPEDFARPMQVERGSRATVIAAAGVTPD